MPDTFFEVDLFTCMSCGAVIAVDRERERYSGMPWEQKRAIDSCPQCADSLKASVKYPETFRCPDGTEGHFVPPKEYPPDSELVTFEVWDVYG